MQLLLSPRGNENSPLFDIISERSLKCLIETKSLTEDILKNTTNSAGNNSFQRACLSGTFLFVEYLLKTDVVTRDVIIGSNNWNKFILELN